MFKRKTAESESSDGQATNPTTDKTMTTSDAAGATLHELDYQDLALSPQGIRLVKRAARSIIDQYMPAVDSSSLSVREALALFVDRVFWDERTGGLYMCTDLVDRSVCLPLPSDHWTVRESVTPLQ